MEKHPTMQHFLLQKGVRSLLITLFLLASTILTACDSGTNTTNAPDGANGNKCNRIGVLLPETTSSNRWETKDHPLLIQAINAVLPGAHIDYTNAQDSQATQLKQAETDLANGDCILVVAAHDSVAAASIVEKARLQHVPVIAYDRLIQSRYLSYYVSFDNIKVGQLQGQYIADHYTDYQKTGPVNIAMISGSQTDTNALLFSQGVHDILDPLFANGTLKNVTETFTPDWNTSIAQAEMQTALSDQQGNIQIAYVANDSMAGASITALHAYGLDGKVLVTGQDATADGIHSILAGTQNMTVYKPISKEAQSAAVLIKALHDGTNIQQFTNGVVTTIYDGTTIPSILDTPIAVDRDNIATTIIADHFLTKNDVCNGIPGGTANVC